jgi:transposase
MWTIENRARYNRSALRYPSDLTEAEWAHVAPVISPARRGGNKRTVNVRDVVNGLPIRSAPLRPASRPTSSRSGLTASGSTRRIMRLARWCI